MVPGNTEKERKLVEHVGQATSEEGSSKPAITTATAASLHWGHCSPLSPLKGELGCIYTDYRPPLVEVPVRPALSASLRRPARALGVWTALADEAPPVRACTALKGLERFHFLFFILLVYKKITTAHR